MGTLQVELALQARNVQHNEVAKISETWAKVKIVVVRQPRLGKAEVGVELLRSASPELFESTYPEPPMEEFRHQRSQKSYV